MVYTSLLLTRNKYNSFHFKSCIVVTKIEGLTRKRERGGTLNNDKIIFCSDFIIISGARLSSKWLAWRDDGRS